MTAILLEVHDTIEKARKFGLHAEVISFAFMRLSDDAKKIREAINHGYQEWIK